MGFLWRRRSSVVKIVILLSAVWFTIAFLIYSEDRRTSNIAVSGPHSLELKYNNEFDDVEDNENGIDNINENIDRFFNNQPTFNKNSVTNENHKNESVVNNVILSNLNNNEDSNDDSNISGKDKRLNSHQRPDVKKPAPDDNGEFQLQGDILSFQHNNDCNQLIKIKK